ncbi:MAG: hypothetical protein CM1200mP39_25350 [Dehalococcoidia bacterium]|nr:MAG: hypothetical protein CM1200mP39_25350 [Dehalococcoidia bacterium]
MEFIYSNMIGAPSAGTNAYLANVVAVQTPPHFRTRFRIEYYLGCKKGKLESDADASFAETRQPTGSQC